jgi:hypothetical protein
MLNLTNLSETSTLPMGMEQPLSAETQKQKEIINDIINHLEGKLPHYRISQSDFNPSLLPLTPPQVRNKPYTPHAFYCLEMAIKIGNLDGVKELFAIYETMDDWKKLMRESIHMEVRYRPIFWLAGVSDPEINLRLYPHLTISDLNQKYYEIICFMETKLEIAADHQHPASTRSFSREEYIKEFCTNEQKRDFLLQKLKERNDT